MSGAQRADDRAAEGRAPPARIAAAKDEFGICGTTLGERYRIVRAVGSGGFGVVYEALHAEMGLRRAVKCLQVPHTADRATFLKDLTHEARMLETLSTRDAGIVQAHDLGTWVTASGAWIPYLVMEWLTGKTLADHIESLGGHGIPPVDALRLLDSAAEALATAHEVGVTHHDVKPANLFLVEGGGERRLKVLDFGLARVFSLHATFTHDWTGSIPASRPYGFTHAYGAPEQFGPDSFGPTGPWTDVFALALVFIELLTGRRALRGADAFQLMMSVIDRDKRPTPRAHGAEVPDAVETVLHKALQVEPQDRYKDVGSFWRALRGAAERHPIPIVPKGDPGTPVDALDKTSPGAEPPPPVNIHYLYSSRDEDMRADLAQHLIPRLQEVTADWTGLRVDPGPQFAAPLADVPRGAVVVVLLSGSLVDSGFPASNDAKQLMDRHWRGEIRLVFVLPDRALKWQTLPFRNFIPLPRFGNPIKRWLDQDVAWRDVSESLRAIVQDVQSAGATRVRRGPPARTYELHDVFKKSGTPDVTFVETAVYKKLVRCLRVPGRGIVVEGPSGVGKTTALIRAIEHLQHEAPGDGDVRVLSARFPSHIPEIETLPQWHRAGTVAIDDFHRLYSRPALAESVADYMKYLADTDAREKKVVIAGVPGSGQTLVKFGADLAMRIDVLRFGLTDTSDVMRMIAKGEDALFVEIPRKADIAVASAGSFNIAHFICSSICESNSIDRTQRRLRTATWNLPMILEKMRDELKPKILPLIEAFGAVGERADATPIRILKELPGWEDGYMSLAQLQGQSDPAFAKAIDDIIRNNTLAGVLRNNNKLEELLFYDSRVHALVAEDPQVLFYLANTGMRKLTHLAGKRWNMDQPRVVIHHSVHDAAAMREIKASLKPLTDRNMDIREVQVTVNPKWKDDVQQLLKETAVLICLITPDYLGSFTDLDELARLLREGAQSGLLTIPILIKPSRFASTRLGQLTPIHRSPLAAITRGPDREAVFRALIDQVRQHVTSIAQSEG